MSATVLWRENLESIPAADSAVVFVAAPHHFALTLAPAVPLAPTVRDLAEAPGHEPSRSNFLARRACARRALAARHGVSARDVTIGHASTGAPFVVAPKTDLHISLAGRENFCAVGLAPSAIGVDIEPLGQVAAPAWNILHKGEREVLARLDEPARHERFLRIWTAKEAYLKALGLGLLREPSEIEIIAASGETFVIGDGARKVSLKAAQWRRVSLNGREFVAACVVLNSDRGV